MQSKTIIISRTDAIGDVILTLPLAFRLKKLIPDCKIIFFGKEYTQPVISACSAIDEYLSYDVFSKKNKEEQTSFLAETNADTIIHVYPRKDIARAAKLADINTRIGTTNRIFHWTTCNRLVRLSRRNSPFHEAVLNIKLLSALGFKDDVELNDLSEKIYLDKTGSDFNTAEYFNENVFKLILHPKSNVSAREWSLNNFRELIDLLPASEFQIFITGGPKEKDMLQSWTEELPGHVTDVTGTMSLNQLMQFIKACDGLIAASTGPLHIAAAEGKKALGLYPPIRPMDPQRWAPIGKQAEYLVLDKKCDDCRLNPEACHCINEITPVEVAAVVRRWKAEKQKERKQ